MGKDVTQVKHTFLFCDGGSCNKKGSEQVVRAGRAYLRNNGLWNTTHTIKTRCNGRCEDAPTCIVQSGDFWYKNLDANKITDILKAHIEEDSFMPQYLLYKDGDAKMDSEKERPAIVAEDFQLKDDAQLGACFISKGFSNEQYLYPLFLEIFNKKVQGTIQFSDGSVFQLNSIEQIEYSSKYTLVVHFSEGIQKEVIIGIIPKEDVDITKNDKVTKTEYYINKDKSKKGIRFSNKFGKFVASIELAINETEFWKYCLEIQLLGKECPTESLASLV